MLISAKIQLPLRIEFGLRDLIVEPILLFEIVGGEGAGDNSVDILNWLGDFDEYHVVGVCGVCCIKIMDDWASKIL